MFDMFVIFSQLKENVILYIWYINEYVPNFIINDLPSVLIPNYV